MEFHSLVHTDITHIHTAFIDAFSEYEVPMELPIERLQAMMQVRSYDPALSLGCFVDTQLVGFVLVGARRDADGILRTYDVATGVVRAYQNQKIGSQLLTHLLPMLTNAGAASFQLEVLEHNVAAQKLYHNHGFGITRTLRCYRTSAIPTPVALADGSWGTDGAVMKDVDETLYSSFAPSWQQAMASYRTTAATCHVVTWHVATHLGAYGIIERNSAAIMQLGVHPTQRTPAMLTALIAALAQQVDATQLRMVNVEAASWIDQQLQALGWENFINQYEMKIQLTSQPALA